MMLKAALAVAYPVQPPAPANVAATVVSANQINLAWPPALRATNYYVKRSLLSGGPYTTVSVPLTVTNFSDAGLVGEVGIFDENISKRAFANEYGVPWENRPGKGRRKRYEYFGVEPTETSSIEENRAWFIPPRPFLRPAFDETAPKAAEEMFDELIKQIEQKLGW